MLRIQLTILNNTFTIEISKNDLFIFIAQLDFGYIQLVATTTFDMNICISVFKIAQIMLQNTKTNITSQNITLASVRINQFSRSDVYFELLLDHLLLHLILNVVL